MGREAWIYLRPSYKTPHGVVHFLFSWPMVFVNTIVTHLQQQWGVSRDHYVYGLACSLNAKTSIRNCSSSEASLKSIRHPDPPVLASISTVTQTVAILYMFWTVSCTSLEKPACLPCWQNRQACLFLPLYAFLAELNNDKTVCAVGLIVPSKNAHSCMCSACCLSSTVGPKRAKSARHC